MAIFPSTVEKDGLLFHDKLANIIDVQLHQHCSARQKSTAYNIGLSTHNISFL